MLVKCPQLASVSQSREEALNPPALPLPYAVTQVHPLYTWSTSHAGFGSRLPLLREKILSSADGICIVAFSCSNTPALFQVRNTLPLTWLTKPQVSSSWHLQTTSNQALRSTFHGGRVPLSPVYQVTPGHCTYSYPNLWNASTARKHDK